MIFLILMGSCFPIQSRAEAKKKEEKDLMSRPPVIANSGGPDAFGYLWIDSDEPGGPVFNWQDISTVGTPITGLTDDRNVGPFPIGFAFPFYGASFTEFRFCTNGFISFTSSSTTYSNRSIPSGTGPYDLVAPFWDDLNFSISGDAYYYYDGSKCIIQYTDVMHYGSSGGPYTFQIWLMPSGTILFQYLSMPSYTSSATVGIQNGDGTIGLQVVYNASYIHDNLAVLFHQERPTLEVHPDSLSVALDLGATATETLCIKNTGNQDLVFSLDSRSNPLENNISFGTSGGSVSPGDSTDADVSIHTTGLVADDYFQGMVQIDSNDPLNPVCNVPVHLSVNPLDYDVSASPADTVLFGFQGDTAKCVLKIKNRGLQQDNYQLHASPGIWDADLYDSAGAVQISDTPLMNYHEIYSCMLKIAIDPLARVGDSDTTIVRIVSSQHTSTVYEVPVITEVDEIHGLFLTYNQIDAQGFPTIASYLNIQDSTGNSIRGLKSRHFTVREDGVTESPIHVTTIDSSGVGVNICLVLDRSGSMGGQKIIDLKDAATFFVNQMTDADQAAIVSFSDAITTDQNFTSDKTALIDAIQGLYDGGGTHMLDAIAQAADLTEMQNPPRALVVMTDGTTIGDYVSEDSIFTQLQISSIPAYTIGLGLTRGSSAEDLLIQIADSSNGQYYYAPSSSDLIGIYEAISNIVRLQYLVTYDTHNPARDGTWRDVEITASFQLYSDYGTNQYKAPEDSSSIIAISSSDSIVSAGDSVWLNIVVGDTLQPVIDLMDLSFALHYDTAFIRPVLPFSDNILAGAFWGNIQNPVITYPSPNSGDSLLLRIQSPAPDSTLTGFGCILKIRVRIDLTAPDTVTCFSMSSVLASNSSGYDILLIPLNGCLSLAGQVKVWPGDTDNNGIVNMADVLPIGVFWGDTGYPRSQYNDRTRWEPQQCRIWQSDPRATFVDANGDSIINGDDIPVIRQNWNLRHSVSKLLPDINDRVDEDSRITASIEKQSDDHLVKVTVQIETDKMLTGIGVEIDYQGRSVQFDSIRTSLGERGNFIRFIHDDPENGTVSFAQFVAPIESPRHEGISRCELYFQSDEPLNGDLKLIHAYGIQANGVLVPFLENSYESIPVSEQDMMPAVFALAQNYPNPFNHATTIHYEVAERSRIQIQIVNLLGERVKTLISEIHDPGYYSIAWQGDDQDGHTVGSGMYYIRLIHGNSHIVRKTIYLK